jgi:hypothetical protein
MTPEVTKTVLNKIILNVWIKMDQYYNMAQGPGRASISVQQLRIVLILM